MAIKSKLGFTCITLTYITIIIEIIGVLLVNTDTSFFLFVNKILFAFECFLAILSHIFSATTDPGTVYHYNNLYLIEEYLNEHQPYFKNARLLNSNFKEFFLKGLDEREMEFDSISLDEGSDFNHKYNKNSLINDGAVEEISCQFDVFLTRCKKCYVVKLPKVHHCSICKAKMDHHCLWIDNCVGAQNQKYFILFCFYSMIGTIHSSCLLIYEYFYMKKMKFLDSKLTVIFIFIHNIVSVFFIYLSFSMLKDQYFAIRNDMILINKTSQCFVEAKSFNQSLTDVFGGGLNFFWFIPCRKKKIKSV